MAEEPSNGRVTNKELYEAISGLREYFDSKFKELDSKYVYRESCIERHKYIDPRQIWAAAAVLAILGPAITAALIAAL